MNEWKNIYVRKTSGGTIARVHAFLRVRDYPDDKAFRWRGENGVFLTSDGSSFILPHLSADVVDATNSATAAVS